MEKDIILNYQAIQNHRGFVILKIEQPELGYESLLKFELVKYFKDDVKFKIIYNQSIIPANGKMKDFITTLE